MHSVGGAIHRSREQVAFPAGFRCQIQQWSGLGNNGRPIRPIMSFISGYFLSGTGQTAGHLHSA